MTNQALVDMDSVEDLFLEENPGPTIAEHILECDGLLKKYMDAPEIVNECDSSLLEDQWAGLIGWASYMEVFGHPNVSLDYKLRYSPTLVNILHQLLDTICASLTARK
jgi:hypothetical protein